MKSTVRIRLAAALLLAPLGFLAAQPAAAQHWYGHPAGVQQPMIERFVLRSEGRIEPGEPIVFRLRGVPGGHAVIDIPGVLRAASMTETRPGVYEASYVVRRRDNPAVFSQAVATLQRDGVRVSARVEVREGWERQARDTRAPEIIDVTPAHGERVGDRRFTRITARVTDDRGIDPASVTLRVDGRDVSAWTRFNGDEVRFRDELAPGRHVAELAVRDQAGNLTRRSWSFEVVDRGYGYGERDRVTSYGYGPRW